MTAEQKIGDIEKQMKACEEQRTNTLNCPYCGAHNKEGAKFCCETLSIVVIAILDRWDANDERERFERIYENVN